MTPIPFLLTLFLGLQPTPRAAWISPEHYRWRYRRSSRNPLRSSLVISCTFVQIHDRQSSSPIFQTWLPFRRDGAIIYFSNPTGAGRAIWWNTPAGMPSRALLRSDWKAPIGSPRLKGLIGPDPWISSLLELNVLETMCWRLSLWHLTPWP